MRTLIFWLHLAAGILAGSIVLMMSVTGVALTYEKQMVEWADRRAFEAPPPSERTALSPETLLMSVRQARPGSAPTSLTLRSHPEAPATLVLDGEGSLLVDPYSGAIVGPPPTGLRNFFRTMTVWHRWLAMEGPGRATGKAITGAANLAFLFLVLSGIYLWFPRIWNKVQFRNVLWFRRGLSAKARDFNWHHVIGFWSLVPLAIVVAGAVPISYSWASRMVYRVAGEEPPGPTPRRSPSSSAGDAATVLESHMTGPGIDDLFARAAGRVPEWRTMTLRLPREVGAALVVAIDEGYGGQPQKRTTLTAASPAGGAEKWETFSDMSAGRKLRSWTRFAHTGEYYGITGQTIAGLVSAAAVVLLWTGVALSYRRLVAWSSRALRPATAQSRVRRVTTVATASGVASGTAAPGAAGRPHAASRTMSGSGAHFSVPTEGAFAADPGGGDPPAPF